MRLLLQTAFLLLGILGSLATATGATLLSTNAVWVYSGASSKHRRLTRPWRALNFDDSAWSSGQAPFYYNEALSGTLLGDMQNNYSGIFLRREFAITNVYEFGALTFAAPHSAMMVMLHGLTVWRSRVTTCREDLFRSMAWRFSP